MALASGANVGISYVAETTRGVTPSTPAMKTLRVISRPINKTKTAIVSQERRKDRQIASVRHGFNQVGGTFGYELSVESFDDMLAAALSNDWQDAPALTGSFGATGTTNKITRTAGGFVAAGFVPGLTVNVGGFVTPGNNGVMQVLAVTDTELTVDTTLTTEAEDGPRTVTALGKVLRVGNLLKTFTFERSFSDISQYQAFRGVAVNTMSVQLQPDQIIGGTLEMLGMSGGEMQTSSLGVPSDSPLTEPLVAFEADLYLDGVKQTVVTSLNFTLANGRSVQPVVGSKFSPDIFEGTCQVTGQFVGFFENAELYNKFDFEEEGSLFAKCNAPGGDFLTFIWTRVKVNSGDMDPPQEGPVSANFSFQSLVDPDFLSSMVIQRSNA